MLQLRKRFGQHLLVSQEIIENIVAAIHPRPSDNIVEIGPGLGALTLPLLQRVDRLQAIELDKDLIPLLQSKCLAFEDKLTLYQSDALRFDFSQIANHQKLKIVGNLPYNVSTPLLFHLSNYRDNIEEMCFMLQQEVVERMVAAPDTSAYGRLSIMLQIDFEMEALFTVPPSAFKPPPQVYSAVVRLIPREKNFEEKIINREIFSKLVNKAFQQRRKTLKNALSADITSEVWMSLGIASNRRAGELTVSDYIHMANHLSKMG